MTNHIIKLLNIYTYQADKAYWTNTLSSHINIISYQLDGRYDHTFDFGTLEVKKDHIFNIGPCDSYSVKRIEKGSSICVTFTSDVPIKTQLMDCTNDPRFSILFKKLLTYRSIGIESNYYMALSIIYEILHLLNKKESFEPLSPHTNSAIAETHNFLLNNFYNNEIDLTQFYEKSGLSDKYFRESFKKLYGLSPTQFLINLRLNEAAKLLSQGVFTVTEVAQTVGFSDVYYFSRLFKKKFGIPPSKFEK